MTEGGIGIAGLAGISLFCLIKGVIAFVAAGSTFATLVPVAWAIGGCVLFLVFASFSKGGGQIVFHGHGDTRSRAWNHEKRHKRVLRALGIVVDRIAVWREGGVWAGETKINKSSANMRRWGALTPVEQAAVYMAGALGPGGIAAEYCSDDLAAVDARTSRAAAARLARRYL